MRRDATAVLVLSVLAAAACAPRPAPAPEPPAATGRGGLESGSYLPTFEERGPDSELPGQRVLDPDIHPG